MTTLDDRLENWGAVWRSRLRSTALASQEGAYRSASARHWDYSADTGRNGVHLGVAPTVSLKADPVDAAAVERAVCAMDIFHHVILKGHYVRLWAPEQAIYEARKAAGERTRKRGNYAASLAMAKAQLAEVIDRPAVIRRRHALALVSLAVRMPTWDDAYA